MKMKKSEKSIFEQFKAPKVDWIMFVYIHVMQEMNLRFQQGGSTFEKRKKSQGIV